MLGLWLGERGVLVSSRERVAFFFSQLVEWFAANPQFEQSLVRVLSRGGVLFWHLCMLLTLELENGCAQHEAGAWGGGGLAGIAQWERRGLRIERPRVRIPSRKSVNARAPSRVARRGFEMG